MTVQRRKRFGCAHEASSSQDGAAKIAKAKWGAGDN